MIDPMAGMKNGRLKMTIHPNEGEELPLRSFADHLVDIHKLLVICDRKANGKASHHYTISDASFSDGSLTLVITEHSAKPKRRKRKPDLPVDQQPEPAP